MNRIKELRLQKRLTQEELGNAIGVRKSSISRYEQEKMFPTPEMLRRLADYFNVSIDYLLGGTATQRPAADTHDLLTLLFPDKPEILRVIRNITPEGALRDADGEYKLSEAGKFYMRQQILSALKEAKMTQRAEITRKIDKGGLYEQ